MACPSAPQRMAAREYGQINLSPFSRSMERAKTSPLISALGLLDAAHFHTYIVHMIKFEWDPAKAASNLKKHGVSFGEAQSVFYDEFALQFFDAQSSETEERFLMLGMSGEAKLLLVCHCERDGGDTIRIISARKATSNERKHYHGGLI